jgi:molybdate transport system substrate-binding protein
MHLDILSGGAAAGLVKGLQAEFEHSAHCIIHGTFSAVGVMRDRLLAGEPCDLIILTQSLIQELIDSGHVLAGSAQSLGLVKTGIAVPSRNQQPRVDSREALIEALTHASAIFSPDIEKSTAGIHFMSVLRKLGLDERLENKIVTFPNGAEAMQAMALSKEPNPIGCTQVTEILYTAGIDLVDVLPVEFELATHYALGICAQAREPKLARALAAMLTGSASAALRSQGGFEFS